METFKFELLLKSSKCLPVPKAASQNLAGGDSAGTVKTDEFGAKDYRLDMLLKVLKSSKYQSETLHFPARLQQPTSLGRP